MNLIYIRLPKNSKVVILEDSPMRIAWFQKRIPDLIVCKTVLEFKQYFTSGRGLCDFVFWDHDLGTKENGEDAAKWFGIKFGNQANDYGVIHSWNSEGAHRMQKLIPGTKHIPFGQFEVETEK